MTMPAHIARIAHLPHVVYCFSDTHARPLYVGCTYDLEQRIGQHSMQQPWWHEVADVRVLATLPNRTEGLAEELRLTREVRPAYNLSMKLPRREWTLDDYLNTLSARLKQRIAHGYGHEALESQVPRGTVQMVREVSTRFGVHVPGPTVRDALAYVDAIREERRLAAVAA